VVTAVAAPRDAPADAERGWTVRRAARAGLELFALCGLAITQPVLDLFGRAPQQFAFRGVQGWGIVAFVVVVALVPTAVLWLVELAVGAVSQRARWLIHVGLVGVLTAVIGLQVVAGVASGIVRVAAAVVLGVGAVVVYQRVAPARTWLAYMALAPVVFVGAFMLASPTSRLLTSPSAAPLVAGVARPAPVVMVVFDELPLASLVTPDGQVDRELYPNIAALADTSSWFRNTTTVSSSTWYAIPALLTGQEVVSGTVPVAADHPESLFTLLGDAYDLNVVESVTRVCPSGLCASSSSAAVGGTSGLLADAMDVMVQRLSFSGPDGDPVASLVEPVAAMDGGDDDGDELSVVADFELNQPERVGAFLDGIVDSRPALHYLHILLPHVPFRYLPSGSLYDGPEPDLGRDGDTWADEPWLTDLARQRHLLQVGYADAVLGSIIADLQAKGLYDESLVIVTSDHGISFQPGHPMRGLEGQPLDSDDLADLAWVPLFVKQPGQTVGQVSDANVLTLDVVPTIADVLGVDIPWQVDGQSVFGPARIDGAKFFRPGDVELLPVALEPLRLDPDVDLARVFGRGPARLLPGVGGGGGARWWTLGPAPDLVGVGVADVPGGPPAEADAVVDDVGGLVLDPGSNVVPALVRGRVAGVAVGQPVAVAINGVIAATAPTYDDGSGVAFAVMVNDTYFRSGPNQVTVHRLG
jgi:hypothetical protein